MVFIEWLACITLSLNFEDLKTFVVFVEQLACVALNMNLGLLWSNRNGETGLVQPLANVGKCLGN